MSTYPVAALGYRLWWVQGDALQPLFQNRVWRPGANLAYCSQSHKAPDQDCGCGLNLYHSIEQALIESDVLTAATGGKKTLVLGAVGARGEMRVHYHGFRAEQAQPLALLRIHDVDNQLSSRYQIPIFDQRTEFQNYINEIKTVRPISADLIPQEPLTSEPVLETIDPFDSMWYLLSWVLFYALVSMLLILFVVRAAQGDIP